MKVLFANNICGHYGGVEQVVLHTARGLNRRGHRCFLAYDSLGRDADTFVETFEETHQCREFRTASDGGPGMVYAEILERVAPDVTFIHRINRLPDDAEFSPEAPTLRMVHDPELTCPLGLGYFRHNRRNCRYPAGWRCYADLAFLVRNHDSRFPVKLQSIRNKIAEMQRNKNLGRILAVSAFVRDRLLDNGFSAETTLLCHPIIETDDCRPTAVPDTPHVLFVGSLIRGKGVDFLLKALAQVSCDFTLTIVGTGKLDQELRSLTTRLGINDKVDFRGWVDHKDVEPLYRDAKVVSIPSCWPESFTLVGQESMRYGRPVIAFNVGGNTDWLEHERTGLIVPEQDVPAYAHALQRLLTDTDYASQLGKAAASRARERFSFEGYLDQIEAHLSESIGGT